MPSAQGWLHIVDRVTPGPYRSYVSQCPKTVSYITPSFNISTLIIYKLQMFLNRILPVSKCLNVRVNKIILWSNFIKLTVLAQSLSAQ